MLPELILMFKSLGNFAFKLGASSAQQHESCVFQAEYWNMLLGIAELTESRGFSRTVRRMGLHTVIFKSLSHS